MSRSPVPRSPLPNPRPSPAAIVAALAISGPGVAIAVAGRPVAAAAGAAVTLVLAQLASAFSREPPARPRRHRRAGGGRRRRPDAPADARPGFGRGAATMSDTFALQHVLAAGGARSALIVKPHPRLPDEVVAAASSPSAGLVALMMAEWRPSATSWVKVTDTSVKPASVSWDWYSAWDRRRRCSRRSCPARPATRGQVVLGDDVADAEAAAGLEHPEGLGEHRRPVDRQVDHAVGDHHLHDLSRQEDGLDLATHP